MKQPHVNRTQVLEQTQVQQQQLQKQQTQANKKYYQLIEHLREQRLYGNDKDEQRLY